MTRNSLSCNSAWRRKPTVLGAPVRMVWPGSGRPRQVLVHDRGDPASSKRRDERGSLRSASAPTSPSIVHRHCGPVIVVSRSPSAVRRRDGRYQRFASRRSAELVTREADLPVAQSVSRDHQLIAHRSHGRACGRDCGPRVTFAGSARSGRRASRRFEVGKDPRGRPMGWGFGSDPVLPKPAQTVIPSAAESKSLADLTPLLSLPAIAASDARVPIRAARSYQNAIWVADTEPQLSWLFLVSAAETAAGHWHREREPALQRLRAWGPGNDLEALLVSRGAEALVEPIAELVADYVGATKKFVEFILTFCPTPPARRPPSGGQLSWDPKELRKTLQQVYGYRSNALHEGRPFPAPMCEPPMRVESWTVPPEVPLHYRLQPWAAPGSEQRRGFFCTRLSGSCEQRSSIGFWRWTLSGRKR